MLSFLLVRPNVQNLVSFISIYSPLFRIFSLDTSRTIYHHYHLLTQWCLTRCKPMDCSPPGPSVHGIFQTRILEWVVISSSRGSRPYAGIEHTSPVSPALLDRFFTIEPPGKPRYIWNYLSQHYTFSLIVKHYLKHSRWEASSTAFTCTLA